MSYECVIGMEEYRAATYYGALMRNRLLFRPLVLLLPLSVAYLLGVTMELWPLYPLVLYVLGAYGVAALVVFGRTEHAMLRYSRSKDSLLGQKMRIRLEGSRLSVDIPAREVHFSGELRDFAGVIELKKVYLAYVSATETFILPRGAMGEFEAAFRDKAAQALGERFVPEVKGKRRK